MASDSRKLTTVSLFSGAGGLDVGFERAGFECIWANEFDRDAAEAWRLNRPDEAEAMHEGDIVSLLDTLPDLRGRADCIIGGPPCQSWSVAGKMDPDDPRGGGDGVPIHRCRPYGAAEGIPDGEREEPRG